ncbi:MAG TPA: FtsX-like permease family protein [Trebonia sp.]
MFFTYLSRELRRRSRQAIMIAFGLALGIGLTITVTAASAGVKAAQGQVLSSLYGVGTDMTVTSEAKPPSGSGGQSFNFRGLQNGSSSSTTNSDTLRLVGGNSAITAATMTKINKVSGVQAAVGSIALTDFNISATINGTSNSSPSTGTGSGSTGSGSGGRGGFGGFGGGGNFNITSVSGVYTNDLSMGPLSTATLASGRALSTSDAGKDDALVSSTYASSQSLKAGSTVTLAGTKFDVVGVVDTDSSSDVYIPLGVAQSLSSQAGNVSEVYVTSDNSTDITSVANAIKKVDSNLTVTTSSDLASTVTGSISSTASLANNLGKWISIAVLIAAFAVAALFTMSAVGRRVRELGTLKALGWTSRRVVRQVMGEAMVTGLIGGVVGIGLGLGGAAVIDAIAPGLTASTGGTNPVRNLPSGSGFGGNGGGGGGTGGGGGGFGGGGGGTGRTPFGGRGGGSSVVEHMTAPVSIEILLIAVALAVLGGLIAGAFGGWRAASLRPADALRKLA